MPNHRRGSDRLPSSGSARGRNVMRRTARSHVRTRRRATLTPRGHQSPTFRVDWRDDIRWKGTRDRAAVARDTDRGRDGGSKKYFKDLQNGLVKSKELVKILIHLYGQRKQKIFAISLARALYCQLDEAVAQVDQLIHHKDSDHGEIYRLVRQFMEEKEMWKKKKHGGIRIAVQSAIEELETERKLRIKAESKNEKLRLELTQMNTSLVNASKQLDSERRTRQMIEQVCGQMIRGIGDNKAEVEELNRESAKAREELEMKRQMLQLADEWREERVQMKLAEAKHQFEEKNATVNQLRHELESFLAVKRAQDPFDGPWDLADDHESDCLRVRQMVHPRRSMCATNLIMDRDTNGEKDQEENNVTNSEDSDLHSIELNMDNNNNGYSWSYVPAAIENEGELALAIEYDEMSTKCGKVSDTEEKVMTEGIKEKIIRKFLQLNNNLAGGRPVDNSSALDQSGEQYVPVEVPRDQNLVGSSITVPFGLPSSTKQLSR
ncbi:hypothetical protein Cni_G10503 [Canna indica]|uniref:Uncharacterized protein n=1 Tax=Canna indica TaxID=4628 RepID=A0AAQ3Q9Y8_9LILI|nr:hypothetical protein Cni_G10503 [Canna indica]